MKNLSYNSKNGKKGGRPKLNEEIGAFIIPNVKTVILTKAQYNTLIEKYGITLVIKALMILDEWLNNSRIGNKYKGKNNYAHFRSDGWVINEAKLASKQQT